MEAAWFIIGWLLGYSLCSFINNNDDDDDEDEDDIQPNLPHPTA